MQEKPNLETDVTTLKEIMSEIIQKEIDQIIKMQEFLRECEEKRPAT